MMTKTVTPATREDNIAFYERILSGDKAAAEEMILRNRKLVCENVKNYLTEFSFARYLENDLIGEGELALVTAVNQLVNGECGSKRINPTGYLSVAITHAIAAFTEEQGPVRVPGRTQRQKRLDGEVIYRPVALGEAEDDLTDPDRLRDLQEEIDDVCESDEDRMIVSLRSQGYNDRQIAEQLGLPWSAVYRLRRDLYKRFLTATGLKGEV
jgi:DNA-directed RNA polymerase specialized sigma subunit